MDHGWLPCCAVPNTHSQPELEATARRVRDRCLEALDPVEQQIKAGKLADTHPHDIQVAGKMM
jgi:hypothetical protein